MKQVTITAEFTTGTTIESEEEAKTLVTRMFFRELEKNNFATEGAKSIFQAKVLNVKAEDIK